MALIITICLPYVIRVTVYTYNIGHKPAHDTYIDLYYLLAASA